MISKGKDKDRRDLQTMMVGGLRGIYNFLCSIKLAVVVILGLGTVSAVGTFVESNYDALTAKKIVYESWWMYGVMGLLVVNLVFVAVDRLPWKRKHVGFVLAHVGIIVLIVGSYITQKLGVDGSMVFGIGEKNKFVSVSNTDLIIYSTVDGDNFERLHEQEVDFLKYPPTENPLSLELAGQKLQIIDFMPYARRETKFIASDFPLDGPAMQFQLTNGRANVLEWVIQDRKEAGVFDMGPAQVVLTQGEYFSSGRNEIVVQKTSNPDEVNVTIYGKENPTPLSRGKLKLGEELKTPWMGLVFKILDFIPTAQVQSVYKSLERPTPLTSSAIKVRFNGEERWLGLNAHLKFFTESMGYVVSYGNRRLDLGFELELKKFAVGRYPGTQMASSYESLVYVPTVGEVTVSMNEPLKFQGFTFYQASFQENQMGEPTASVLSVNRDPGRWIKYLGCFIMVLGIIAMFYFKRAQTTRNQGKVQ